MESRTLYQCIWRELISDKPMVFLVGPRQSGKTTLSQIVSRDFANHIYMNWDIADHKALFMEDPAFFIGMERVDASPPLVVLDEIHKYRDWKNYLKGVYDQYHQAYQFLVSGSGRLDLHRKGGDSLAGRYFMFHLWPFTLSELAEKRRSIDSFIKNPLQIDMEEAQRMQEIWTSLSEFGGFPEPFLKNNQNYYRRWSNTYSNQLIREDIRDLTGVKSVNEIEALYLLLPSKIGSPVSIPSLAGDLKVSYNSVRSWLAVLEQYFLVFSVSAWSKSIARAIQKERKIYIWDTPRIKNPAARFENMVALELFRAVTAWTDMGYGKFSLHFIKNKEKQEVDFLIAREAKPLLLVEAKRSDPQPSVPLKKFQAMLGIPAVQLTETGTGFRYIPNQGLRILVAPGHQWLARLP